MGVTYHNGVNGRRVDGKGLPISLSQVLEALKQATIKQEAEVTNIQQKPRTCHGAGGSQKLDCHIHKGKMLKIRLLRFMTKIIFCNDGAHGYP